MHGNAERQRPALCTSTESVKQGVFTVTPKKKTVGVNSEDQRANLNLREFAPAEWEKHRMKKAILVPPCFFLALYTIVTASFDERVLVVAKRCPDPFVFVGEKCYWFYRGVRPADQAQARLQCEGADSRLARVTEAETQRALTKWIEAHEFRRTSYWIGLYDVEGNGEFRWNQDGDEAEFTAWGEGQPDHSLPQRGCVRMSARFSHAWEAVPCTQMNLFICEKELSLRERTLLRATNNMDQFCHYRALGYYADPTNCRGYILCFGKNIRKYRCPRNEIFNADSLVCEAEDSGVLCNTENAATTASTTKPQSTTAAEMSYGLYGNNDYSEKGHEQEGEYGSDEYGSDQYYNVGENCEEMGEEEEMGNFPHLVCDEGFAKLGKKCYSVSYNTVSWNVANEICIGDEGGRLAMIKNRAVQQFLNRQIRRSTRPVYDFWIGLNDQEDEDKYVWSDKSVLCEWSWSNWSKTSRKRFKRKKKCVQMRKDRGLWEDNICSLENGYICEKDAVNASLQESTEGDISPLGFLPTDWKSRNSLCGTSRRQTDPATLVGGIEADVLEHPWQASLRSFGKHRCGGTLIDNCWILTAAHCVDSRVTGHANRPTLVVLGDVDTSVPEGNEKFLPLARIILHPTWTASPVPTHDIALVKLRRCVDDLNPICLPGRDFDTFGDGDRCKVAGWGSMDSDRKRFPSRLREANVPILSQTVCRQKYSENGRTLIKRSMFCAGYLRGGVDACQGDSGGPLACWGVKSSDHAVQWGVVSWGFGCAQRNKPGVYTKVADYMDWIRNETRIDF